MKLFNSLNNVLLIGITSRVDMIDMAVLKSVFSAHVKIGR